MNCRYRSLPTLRSEVQPCDDSESSMLAHPHPIMPPQNLPKPNSPAYDFSRLIDHNLSSLMLQGSHDDDGFHDEIPSSDRQLRPISHQEHIRVDMTQGNNSKQHQIHSQHFVRIGPSQRQPLVSVGSDEVLSLKAEEKGGKTSNVSRKRRGWIVTCQILGLIAAAVCFGVIRWLEKDLFLSSSQQQDIPPEPPSMVRFEDHFCGSSSSVLIQVSFFRSTLQYSYLLRHNLRLVLWGLQYGKSTAAETVWLLDRLW